MNPQFDVNPFASAPVEPPRPLPAGVEAVDLLRQILELEREQVGLLRGMMAAHDAGARWRNFLARWREAFPDLGTGCRESLQVLEKAYAALIADMVESLRQAGGELDSDFALQEFLDRYGMRLAQLGTILSLVAPIAEAGQQGESG